MYIIKSILLFLCFSLMSLNSQKSSFLFFSQSLAQTSLVAQQNQTKQARKILYAEVRKVAADL